VLQSLDVLARDSDKESITVIQPGGDKGVDERLCICQGECWTKFGDVPEVIENCLTEVFDVGVKSELGVHFNTQVGGRFGQRRGYR